MCPFQFPVSVSHISFLNIREKGGLCKQNIFSLAAVILPRMEIVVYVNHKIWSNDSPETHQSFIISACDIRRFSSNRKQ